VKIIGYGGGRVGVTDTASVWDVSALSSTQPGQFPPVAAVDIVSRFDELRPRIDEIIAGAPIAALADVVLDTPIPWCNKLLAYPANYDAHVAEMHTGNRADVNGFFLKATSSLSGAGAPVVLPVIPEAAIHHESELAIIIGRGGRNIATEDARKHVFGYSCLIDVTVRGKQERVMRKSFDSFCPVGPWIVTADEVADPTDLDMTLTVNGELRQQANTRDLIVGIDEMVALASSVCTLYPGDLIATGTPAGVGLIVPGDEVTIRIASVGEMTVQVIAGGPITNRAFPTTMASAPTADI
jgi:2-keto-4-pentenoate hydratase/2-oxohepta-3-ene-1,7-dioic acid hydratase in catechol pathway